jgi:hypothetical protein
MAHSLFDDEPMNLKDGLWIKDVEAASQGCFSIRNRGEGYSSYIDEFPKDSAGKTLIRVYEDINDIPSIIKSIDELDPDERKNLIEQTVSYIQKADRWQETALKLLKEVKN